MSKTQKSGFTLLEILLVVGIIAILAGIVIIAINPSKQLADTRNAQRRADVLTILNAIYQYSIDRNGAIPTAIVSTDDCDLSTNQEIATSTTAEVGYVNLYSSLVTSSSTYVVEIPRDPLATSSRSTTAPGSGYAVVKTDANRVTVCAPLAENGAVISVTR